MSGFTLRVNKGIQTSTGHVFDMVLTSLMLSWTEPTTAVFMICSPCVSPFVAMKLFSQTGLAFVSQELANELV